MITFEDAISTILECRIIHDIGQFTNRDIKLLDEAVKHGMISKGKGGEFPKIKTVYAPIGFDFKKHRKAVINHVNKLSTGELPQIDWIKHKFNYSSFIK